MRRGQLLSIDALLSLVIVVMVVGVVINTNDMIKAEITNLVEWYDRANVANNMLDILTKSPGYPKDWDITNAPIRVLGLVSSNYPPSLAYNKILGLKERIQDGDPSVIDSLRNLSSGNDFMFEIYLRKYSISTSGFPITGIYIIVGAPNNNVNFRLSDSGNSPFDVVCGSVTLNGEPLSSSAGNILLDLTPDDVVEFIPLETVYVYSRGSLLGTIPPNAVVTVEVIDVGSNLQLRYNAATCQLQFTGIGRVYVQVKAYAPQDVNLTYDFTPVSNVTEPVLRIIMINGTIYAPNGTLYTYNDALSSMNNSQWIEVAERSLSMVKKVYKSNLTLTSAFSGVEPIIIGKLKLEIPNYAYLNVTLIGTEANASFLAVNGDSVVGVFAYKSGNITEAVIVENGTIVKKYSGSKGNVMIPLKDIFPEVNIAELYITSFEGTELFINTTWNLGVILEPRVESCRLKLWVWDER
ncbi:hypothetical protein [Thermococcus barophilus]|uniref:Uncharacterized protein n=1 Tax=Thermococcus barophilus TaxID=55802 RepID=A0A0S1XET8_THEBA|nr:hypothetical protein [Thermococcus barophilus]ALM76310.1 conserved exported hypothetical protein [Thermococcus barophilus]